MAGNEAVLRTAVYCRVSTAMDSQDGSFETQMDYYRNLVERSTMLTLVDMYGDHGKSGRSMKGRPELKRLLEDCAAGKIDLILTKSISRFARNMKECVETIRKLTALKVRVYFEKENIDTANMAGELFMTILATLAEEESNSISGNIRLARKQAYQLGAPVERASYGYRSDKDHAWKVYEPEAERVRLAFYMAGTCHRYPEIREALNRLEESEGTGKVWKATPINNMLTNYAYIGDYLSNKQTPVYVDGEWRRRVNRGEADQYYITDHHEAVVSHELFGCVQELLENRTLFAKRTRFSKYEEALMERSRRIAEVEFHGRYGR